MMGVSKPVETIRDTRLSFKPFVDFLRKRLKEETSIKKDLLQYVLEKFSASPALEGEVAVESLPAHKEKLDLLYSVLSAAADDEKASHWGLSVPNTPMVFYGSDTFYDLLSVASLQAADCALTEVDWNAFVQQKITHLYSFILDRFYGIQFRMQSKLVRNVLDARTGLTRHFKINIDSRFVEVTANSELPQMNIEVLRSRLLEADALDSLRKLLPLEMFSFSGFSIISITDVTSQAAVDSIRNKIVHGLQHPADNAFPQVVQALKELVANNHVEFNILPFFKVNGKLVNDSNAYSQSILFSSGCTSGISEKTCMAMMEKFNRHPKLVYFGDLEQEIPNHPEIAQMFTDGGVKSYALVPVIYNQALVGTLEIYSLEKGLLDEKMFGVLEPAMPLIAQLMHNSITNFNDRIETVIKEKFTTLQPPVQWKFNEVALNYIRERNLKGVNAEPEDIYFENVYPLYGAVDIRNSTIERNAALAEDLKVQFTVLLDVLKKLKKETGFGLLDEKIFTTKEWLRLIRSPEGFNEEIRLNDFLENEMSPFLAQFVNGNDALMAIAKDYFDAIDEGHGVAQSNRRELEKSMSTVISAVNNYFDMLRGEIQHAYPCYFDKFRTDGVEYDIYIGQSITPDKPYSDIYLNNLRLMQLSSMAAIAKYSHSLKPLLSRPVETTQLIFIHSHPIDIRFRRDEKRFDVEGAYNIRYHIIKKRIDKVHLRGSVERLTQPGKIALVYVNQREADEYINYIHYLQGEGILNNDLEYVELEELQGVSGLKAMRVGVALTEDVQLSVDEAGALLQSVAH